MTYTLSACGNHIIVEEYSIEKISKGPLLLPPPDHPLFVVKGIGLSVPDTHLQLGDIVVLAQSMRVVIHGVTHLIANHEDILAILDQK